MRSDESYLDRSSGIASADDAAAVEFSRNAEMEDDDDDDDEDEVNAAATGGDEKDEDELPFGTHEHERDSRENGSKGLETPIWTALASRM